MPNIDWNASDYQKHFSFVPSYGESVMELLTKPEGAFVVDLGCGNGMLTKKLAEKGYHVLGVDDSETMLRLAEKNCSGISFQKGNAVDFSLKQKADAIFSNAVLHWIDAKDQQKMLDNICHQLVLGGEFVCEFGGYGCAEQVHSSWKNVLQPWYDLSACFLFSDDWNVCPDVGAGRISGRICEPF